jgi:hypothetical protein
MKSSHLALAPLLILLAPVACSTSEEECEPDRARFDEIVRPAIATYCAGCHGETPSFGAPASLLDYDQLVAPREDGRLVDRIVARLDEATMPPAAMPRPPAEPIQAIMAWASCDQKQAPATEGLVSSAPPYLSPEEPPVGLDIIDLLAGGFQLGADELDLYRCFVFDAPSGDDRFIRRFDAVIDDARIIHHIVLLRDAEGTAPETDYDCLNGMPPGSEYLYTWAPGGGAFEFPDGGLRIGSGDRFVVQIHYNNGSHVEGVADDSGVRLYAGPAQGTEYGQVAVGPIDFNLPPNTQTDAVSHCRIVEPTRVLAGMPHMHVLGDSFEQRLIRASGEVEDVVTITGWQFDAQMYYALPVELTPGDRLETTCRFKNTTPSLVQAGPGTLDEMCFNFMYVTPPTPGRYCDDTDDTKPTDVDYAPGECAPVDAPTTAPLVAGIWIEGDAPTLTGGTFETATWVLDETTFYVSEASTPIGEIDLDATFLLARGRAFTGGGRLSFDMALDVYLKAVEGQVFGGPYEISMSGPYDVDDALLMWAPDCPVGEEPADVEYHVDGDELTIGFTSDVDIPGAILKQRYLFKREP